MSRWIGIGLLVGGLAWLVLAILVSNLPLPGWDYRPIGSAPIFADPRSWPIYAAMGAALSLSGLGVIRRARINGAVHGSR